MSAPEIWVAASMWLYQRYTALLSADSAILAGAGGLWIWYLNIGSKPRIEAWISSACDPDRSAASGNLSAGLDEFLHAPVSDKPKAVQRVFAGVSAWSKAEELEDSYMRSVGRVEWLALIALGLAACALFAAAFSISDKSWSTPLSVGAMLAASLGVWAGTPLFELARRKGPPRAGP